MKKILVSGYIGFNNFGDEAIFYALSNYLKQKNMFVSVLCSNKKEVKSKYNVKAYNYKKISQILKAVSRCDVLISGGGSLLQNKTSDLSLFYYLFIILLAKIFNKKVIIFAQGIEPIRGFFQTQFTRFVLSLADLITVRDISSQCYLRKLFLKSELVSDPIYSLIQDEEIKKDRKGLVVQLRSYKGTNEKLLDDLASAIARYYLGSSIKVLSMQDEFDKEICLKFRDKLNKLGKTAEFIWAQPIDKTLEIISSAEYVISERLHGVMSASAYQVKTFALIYDEKIRTVSDELNIQNIDIKDYTKDDLNKKLDDFFNNNQNEPHYGFRRFNWDCIDYILK